MENVWVLKDEYTTTTVHRTPKLEQKKTSSKPSRMIPYLLSLPIAAFPTFAYAEEGGNSFDRIYNVVMQIFDYAVLLSIVVTGALWLTGHRSKAIENMIGAVCGYLIAMNAVEIRDFLKSLA